MLEGFFNYDYPVWRFIGKLGDLVLLNLLWLVCCIPVFTAGAATTAVYYVTLKLVRDEDDSTIKSFFRSFIQNFKQATAIWLLILLAGSLVAFDLWFTDSCFWWNDPDPFIYHYLRIPSSGKILQYSKAYII